ncbi:response regulator [Cupriavidus sp. IDO]|uniref:response regulator n=1 Tax=Cupriavidus sp. IDO TaxID=1539142 RepID=UPI00068F5E0C|nr:response regulator [Cupriavidus sp. IDO]KWR89177.1 hypothetical protein RM96_14565 [Cupriavidus sp. IDO]
MKWNILIVDDDAEIAASVDELIAGNKVVAAPDTIACTRLTTFEEAIAQLETSRFDLIILDLKDDEADAAVDDGGTFSGEKVLEALRASRFTPVIFHSGFAHKVVHLKSPFVRVVTKGEPPATLRAEISNILGTRLPQLVRHIEEQQRSYLWDHIENHWKEGEQICEGSDLAYLVAKRLSNALGTDSIRRFFNISADDDTVRPVEMYIWPPLNNFIGFGDILVSVAEDKHFVVLTPACDCAQGKVEKALLAECSPIERQPEYVAIAEDKMNKADISKSKRSELTSLIRDRRSRKGFQPERYKFLPKTMFLPDLVVDLQQLCQITFSDLQDPSKFRRIATLDSPFAEALQNRFTQYYGRVGTPDLHADMLYERIIQ